MPCLVFYDFFQVDYPLFKISLPFLLLLIVTMGIVSGFLGPTDFFIEYDELEGSVTIMAKSHDVLLTS